MFGGRIAQVASPKEFYQRPRTRKVADFLGGMNFLKAKVLGEQGNTVSLDAARFGAVSLDKPHGFAATDGHVTVGIRPERLRLLWDDDRAPHELSGRVENRAYFGEVTHLTVGVDGLEQPLSMVETNNSGADDLPIGAEIRLAYDPDAFVLLAEDAPVSRV